MSLSTSDVSIKSEDYLKAITVINGTTNAFTGCPSHNELYCMKRAQKIGKFYSGTVRRGSSIDRWAEVKKNLTDRGYYDKLIFKF
ncbi:MAG: hypothetical protein GY804_08570 [Alphaproteobacteria bacterium]|nr:hypothetical protein [Alphaproteobacteria bacterium]